MQETNQQRIMKVFFDFPTEKFHIRELARRTKLNPNSVIKTIKKLSKEKLLIRQKKKHLVEISVSRSQKFKILKRIDNLKRLHDSGIIDEIEKNFLPSLILVLGSYSNGDDIENSDIDLVVISKNKKNFELEKYEKILKRKIHLIISETYDNFSDEFYTNLINGIVLYGFIEKR